MGCSLAKRCYFQGQIGKIFVGGCSLAKLCYKWSLDWAAEVLESRQFPKSDTHQSCSLWQAQLYLLYLNACRQICSVLVTYKDVWSRRVNLDLVCSVSRPVMYALALFVYASRCWGECSLLDRGSAKKSNVDGMDLADRLKKAVVANRQLDTVSFTIEFEEIWKIHTLGLSFVCLI